jgi:alcohol dehydrogenase class IV
MNTSNLYFFQEKNVMKNNFTLVYPPKIIFGQNSLKELPDNLPVKSRILLVTGKSLRQSGRIEEVENLLSSFPVIHFCGIPPEPPLSSVDELAALGRKGKVTAVVAIGGGSVIDAAKAAAILIPREGACGEYFHGNRKILDKGLFFAALPTTAGTGAEITVNSVLTDTATKIKKSLKSPFMVPDLAIVDPVLTLGASPELTAASGLDAFTQAVESFTSADANIATKALACKAAGIIFRNLTRAYENSNDMDARTEMAKGSLLSAMAFSQSGLGAVHGLAHPAGALLGIPHGVICAILLSPVLEWNLPECRTDYDELAKACGLRNANEFIAETRELSSKLKIPPDLSGYGLKSGHFPFIMKNCRSRSMECNPRQMTDADISKLLESLK